MVPNERAQIVVVQAADLLETKKLIPDLATWVQCFSLYAAVVVSKEPERAKNLLAYMSLIAKCSMKYRWPSWAVYDLNFRQEAAETGLKDWSKVDPSTYTQCFTGATINQENWCRRCHSIDDSCPIKSAGVTRKREAVPAAAPAPKKRPPPHSNAQTSRSTMLTMEIADTGTAACSSTSATAAGSRATQERSAQSSRKRAYDCSQDREQDFLGHEFRS